MHRAIKSFLVASLILGLSAVTAQAEERGTHTRAWLDLQRGGAQASDTPRPMSGDQAQRIHERYLESFSHPIPEFYRDPDEISTGGD